MNLEQIFHLAVKNHKNKDFDLAIKFYKEVLEKQPNHTRAYFNLGILYNEKGDLEKSKNFYQKLINIEPNNLEAYLNLAILYKNLKDFKNSIFCYEKIIQINPSYIQAYNNLGKLLVEELAEYEKAIDCYKKAIDISPENVDASYNTAVVFQIKKDYKNSIYYYEKVIKIKPNYCEAINNLGIVYIELKDYKKAINNFNKILNLEPNFSQINYNIGLTYKLAGQPKKAIEYLKKEKNNISNLEILKCYYLLNDMDEYEKLLKQISVDNPCDREIANLTVYVSGKMKRKNIYPFCIDPFKFLKIQNLKEEIKLIDKFASDLLIRLNTKKTLWEPSANTTIGGYHTYGNLFFSNFKEILFLKKIIINYMLKYKKLYNSEELFIKKWPEKMNIIGWHVKLLKQGYQKTHIHPDGWLSGVFYLKIPKKINKDEASIMFTENHPNLPYENNLKNIIHVPKEYDLVLFPSSLSHKTIPFKSDEERQIIAFDFMPA